MEFFEKAWEIIKYCFRCALLIVSYAAGAPNSAYEFRFEEVFVGLAVVFGPPWLYILFNKIKSKSRAKKNGGAESGENNNDTPAECEENKDGNSEGQSDNSNNDDPKESNSQE